MPNAAPKTVEQLKIHKRLEVEKQPKLREIRTDGKAKIDEQANISEQLTIKSDLGCQCSTKINEKQPSPTKNYQKLSRRT